MATNPQTPQLKISIVEETPTRAASVDDLRARRTDELIIALIGPVGSGCTTCAKILGTTLSAVFGYEEVVHHKVSDVIIQNAAAVGTTWDSTTIRTERVRRLQDIGNSLRQKYQNDYLAAKVIEKIAEHRFTKGGYRKAANDALVPEPRRCAFIIDSLKNPAELALLRQVYGDMLWVFGVFAPEEVRRDRLKNRERWDESQLADLFERDSKQEWNYGQGVRDTFHQADFFIRNDGENDETVKKTIERHPRVIFGEPVITPTRDESAMYAAHAAAAMSACMSRQVGAALLAESGELLGVGWNDVPKFGGGLYVVEDEQSDNRCYKWGGRVCHNDERKDLLYKAIFKELADAKLLRGEVSLLQAIEALKRTDVKQLIEYSRAVHAEMDALIAVARAGKQGLDGATLYCTTFPCHSCARHLLAAGVEKVIYIEPYPKSLTLELHRDAASSDVKEHEKKMVLQQYEGVSPRNLLRLFKQGEPARKVVGKLVDFVPKRAHPLSSVSVDDFSVHEKRVVSRLQTLESSKAQP
ncbi:MAG TPA: anti-phage dCTP deaminase [Steroidobacteraceae bacterium]|nr:anti-phage dCTP deaminase [Steroidobacteraceae bacterium]